MNPVEQRKDFKIIICQILLNVQWSSVPEKKGPADKIETIPVPAVSIVGA